MENLGRGERMVRIFVYLMAHYNNRYSVADIMRHLDIPESELRSVQRDMQALINIEGGYIQRNTENGKTYYWVALDRACKLVFPDFGDMVLHFVFLQRIANLYPATASLIEDLTKRITQDLPAKQQDVLKSYSKELNGRILFMGTPPGYDENVGKNLPIILNAIRKKQKIKVVYTDNWGNRTDKPRIPLMVAISQGDIYIGCVSQHHPDKTYALKLQRIESVKLLKETFEEDSKVVESLRKRIRTGSLRQELFEGTPVPPLHEDGRCAGRRDTRDDEGRSKRFTQAVDYVLWEHRNGPTAEKVEADGSRNSKGARTKVRVIQLLVCYK